MKKLLLSFLLLTTFLTIAQRPQRQGSRPSPIKITGNVIDKDTGQSLEYATLVLQRVGNPEKITGGITDESGRFDIEIFPGVFNIRVEYITYKTYELKSQTLRTSTDLGTIELTIDVEQLEDVEVVGERTTVELRLDKKVYNVGSDLTVKGGSVTDVLDNVPSVTVDVEGNISLRGNESVRILINGKPSALSGLSPDALQQLPADAIEKVEVITNPSARYDAEGTAGILNIILRQNKTAGLNGSINAFAGYPDNFGSALSLNLRRDRFNIFTTTTYRYRNAPGNAQFLQENFDANENTESFQDEFREYQREDDGINTNIGFEIFLDEDTQSSITNSFVYRRSNGDNTVDVDFFNFDALRNPTIERNRFTNENEFDENIQYSVNYQKKFKRDGKLLTADYQYSKGLDIENSVIREVVLGDNIQLPTEQTINDESQINQLAQFDYVHPFGKDNESQFEVGYRGTFNTFTTDFVFGILDDDILNPDPDFSNELIYKEYVNAAYAQLGTKIDKFSILGGMRMEASDIGIALVNTNDVSEKDYIDWFPSLFFGYELSEYEQFTVSYSKRLRRPRSRFINPFPSRSSNTNLFQGNPNLDPTYTNVFDLGYIKRWDKITLTTSGYYNRSTGVFQFITQETGDFVEIENPDDAANPIIVPIQVRTPINLATDTRFGGELTTTYTPKKDWRLTLNLNLFQQQLRGNFTFTNFLGEQVSQNFDADNFTWFSRLSAKIPFPGKIDFQTNALYRGRRVDAQNVNKGILSTNLALSKDIVKDKATLSLNVSDVFNSRKRITETRTENVLTDSEFQFRERQLTLSFLYRFNQTQNERNRREGRGRGDEDMEFDG
ncbi:hypothetical protein HME9304_02974 [Flagellimonas maritima]|uniref:TonB-dependent receptor n=1 Tax=Flagellimonas maritima TaxID=1383885 RepID=A0A2Z4LW04_9FLAO|nr:outer membrane beta-barrel family protein [Allomuricauda aurantiaca]AWX45942.1 hypothetical protein HME9304_02974 [Allomuricauda aurantiaca]